MPFSARSIVARFRKGNALPRTASFLSVCNNFIPSNSSVSFAYSLGEIEASAEWQDTSIDEDFLSNHLNNPHKSSWLEENAESYIDEIKKGDSISAKPCGPLSSLLDEYSEHVYGQCSL